MQEQPPDNRGLRLTRRGLISSGGAATAAALIARQPGALAAAADAAAAAPSPLRRSSYAGLEGSTFSVGAGTAATRMKLGRIADLTGAPGSDDAFSLSLSGATSSRIEQGTHRFSHSSLGTFDLFVTPVESHGSEQRYEVIVNRPAPRKLDPAPAPPAQTAKPEPAAPRPGAIVRVTARRTPKGVSCGVRLARGAKVTRVTAWLVRGDRVVGAATTRRVKDGRVKLLVRTAKPLRRSGYEVVLIASSPDGRTASKRTRVTRP
jgi:hypothetical protein